MPGVTTPRNVPWRVPAQDSERGAVAIFVAVLLVALFGFGAYVIDAGAIYGERSGLQDGADGAALALAFDCLANDTVTTCSDTGTTRLQAEYYAESNSHDGAATILGIDFDTSNKTVTVQVGTKDASDGNDEIDFVLAPALGKDSAGFSADATVSWGTPIDLPILPIAMSYCEWDEYTSSGSVYGVDTADITSYPLLNLVTSCTAGPAVNLNRGFGYLESLPGCQADISDEHVQGQTLLPGAVTTAAVLTALQCTAAELVLDDGVYIPIFDEIVVAPLPDPPCDNALEPCYHIYGYAKFEIDDSPLDLDMVLLPLDLAVITGRFVEFTSVDYFGEIDPDLPNLGLNAIRLSE